MTSCLNREARDRQSKDYRESQRIDGVSSSQDEYGFRAGWDAHEELVRNQMWTMSRLLERSQLFLRDVEFYYENACRVSKQDRNNAGDLSNDIEKLLLEMGKGFRK